MIYHAMRPTSSSTVAERPHSNCFIDCDIRKTLLCTVELCVHVGVIVSPPFYVQAHSALSISADLRDNHVTRSKRAYCRVSEKREKPSPAG